MILIGENLNVMSQTLGPALRERNAGPIVEMARAETAAGVDLIDLNIGPARRGGDELMAWVVNTVQGITDKMLSLDTTNLDAMEAGLKARQGPVLINSVSLQTSRVDRGLELARKYNADLIGLLWSNDGMPRDVNERAMHTVDFIYKANALGVPNERIWVDPIASPVSVEINQVKACVEFMTMLGEIAPGCKSTVGLSNVSNGAPHDLRGWLNRTYMIMLMRYGLHSAIVDAFDKDLIQIARGRRPDIVALVHKLMDGEAVDIASLPREMANYARTVRVLKGDSLYSHSWLEV
ncbi:MAG TPA: dihydropteroate synthase [Dehalococcoidales bacterium]|nr:MAG: dihydropteroate synthase [Chloroflexi bacterium RBG_16_60_22]HJX12365.1 dihydropteroate synthase [Dehalococcoidales bacterium]